MIDLNQQNEWQLRDPDNGLVMPYYTHPALEEISKWDLVGKRVFEYWVGASTLWWHIIYKQPNHPDWETLIAHKL